MAREKTVREPKQARSLQMKERILETAYRLFCEKGYYKTSTNEIARAAGVSIGSLYSYYKDKDTIFMEILERYHREFIQANAKLYEDLAYARKDIRAWLRELIDNLIQVHSTTKELNRELDILSYAKPEVAQVLKQQQEESRKVALDFLRLYRGEIQYDDVEAAAAVSFEMMSAAVHGIVYEKYDISRERIIGACVEAVCRFLIEPAPPATAPDQTPSRNSSDQTRPSS